MNSIRFDKQLRRVENNRIPMDPGSGVNLWALLSFGWIGVWERSVWRRLKRVTKHLYIWQYRRPVRFPIIDESGELQLKYIILQSHEESRCRRDKDRGQPLNNMGEIQPSTEAFWIRAWNAQTTRDAFAWAFGLTQRQCCRPRSFNCLTQMQTSGVSIPDLCDNLKRAHLELSNRRPLAEGPFDHLVDGNFKKPGIRISLGKMA